MARLREDLGRPGTAHPSPVGTPCRTRGIIARAGLNRAPQNGSHWFRMEPVIIMLPCPRKRCTAVMSLLSASSLVATVGAARAGANEPPAPTAKGLGRGVSGDPVVRLSRRAGPIIRCRVGQAHPTVLLAQVCMVGAGTRGHTLWMSDASRPGQPCTRASELSGFATLLSRSDIGSLTLAPGEAGKGLKTVSPTTVLMLGPPLGQSESARVKAASQGLRLLSPLRFVGSSPDWRQDAK